MIGMVGTSGVGFINEVDHFHTHFAMGIFCLAGYGFAIIYSFILCIVNLVNHQAIPTVSNFVVAYVPLLIIGVFIIIQLIRIKHEEKTVYGLNRIEWMLFLMALYWNLLIIIIF
jgi:hypothetical protein